jgi:hypothetical protein
MEIKTCVCLIGEWFFLPNKLQLKGVCVCVCEREREREREREEEQGQAGNEVLIISTALSLIEI